MHSDAATVEQYLGELPDDRRSAIEAVRRLVVDNLPDGFDEVLQHGMISYVVPLERYPDTYNGQPLAVVSLANQKRHMALYLMGIYADADAERRLREQWEGRGRRLDMGKSCLRFRAVDDLELDLVADAVAATTVDGFIAAYEASRAR